MYEKAPLRAAVIAPWSVATRRSPAGGVPGSVPLTIMSAAAEGRVATTDDKEESIVLPKVPLPEIIISNVPGSWAHDTMVSVSGQRRCLSNFLSLKIRR